MKHALTLLLLGTTAFCQEAPALSPESRFEPSRTLKLSERFLSSRDDVRRAPGNATVLFQQRRYGPQRAGERMFVFEDRTRSLTDTGATPFQGKRYQPPRRGVRVFFFKDKAGNAPPKEGGRRLSQGDAAPNP